MAKPLAEGDKAPTFSLEADGAQKVSLKDLSGKPAVLYFYPKDDTPGCTKEALDFTAAAAAFKKLGATVIGVSKDTSPPTTNSRRSTSSRSFSRPTRTAKS